MKRGEPTSPPLDLDAMVKPVDAWWTVLFVDPIATRVVPWLARHPVVTPSRITLVAHALAIVSAVLFATDNLVAGAVVFELRFIGDCLDGKLARVTGQSSFFGRDLDAWGDRILVMVNFAALGWAINPLAALVVVGAYPVSFHLLEVRDQVLEHAGQRAQHRRMRDRGYGAAMARRRLYPMPTPIEAEHLALFIAPLLVSIGIEVVGPAFTVVAAFFVFQSIRYLAVTLRTGATVDQQSDQGRLSR